MTLTRRGRIVLALVLLLSLVGLPVGGGYLYLSSVGFFGSSDPHGRVEISIPEGTDVGEIGEILEGEGVIRSSSGFRLATYFRAGDESIEAGRYELPLGLTARDALDRLLDATPLGPDFVSVTFPEGSWLTDFARIVGEKTHLSEKSFLDLVSSGKLSSAYLPDGVEKLEGLLFPSTYQIVETDSARSVARRLIEEFEEQAGEADLSRAESLGVTPYEAVTIASMIEAEAALDEERPMIARVIYNRLDQGMTLGIDATVLYALGEHKDILTREDLGIDSPYNTRIVSGLPPTPIGAPGHASLKASVAPAEGEWLYYVLADCEGHHAFSVAYEDFLVDKAAYQALEC